MLPAGKRASRSGNAASIGPLRYNTPEPASSRPQRIPANKGKPSPSSAAAMSKRPEPKRLNSGARSASDAGSEHGSAASCSSRASAKRKASPPISSAAASSSADQDTKRRPPPFVSWAALVASKSSAAAASSTITQSSAPTEPRQGLAGACRCRWCLQPFSTEHGRDEGQCLQRQFPKGSDWKKIVDKTPQLARCQASTRSAAATTPAPSQLRGRTQTERRPSQQSYYEAEYKRWHAVTAWRRTSLTISRTRVCQAAVPLNSSCWSCLTDRRRLTI